MRACEFIEALLAEKSEHLALRYVHHVFEGLFSINWLAAWLFNVSAYRQIIGLSVAANSRNSGADRSVAASRPMY